ncbi:MAG: tRNA (adenosine(37)-N6)-dimethylallyltransferase MiaA [Bacteroidales bacterium]|nr:tRNA (adenosine(37)-N6)-dimethylallyltransferase MiaA [Bacteroidales bacterium]
MKQKLIVISGPTAVGKTSLSIETAKTLHTEIISADSRQFYKELNIGVAAPSKAQLSEVKHYFIRHLSVTDYYNVSRFEQDVLKLLKMLFEKYEYVVMVGGSGLYIDAVCKGIDALPDPDPELREKLKDMTADKGLEPLRIRLKELDPDYYGIVDLDNPNRLLRALEVCMITGEPYSKLRKNKPRKRNFEIIKIGLDRPRSELFSLIENRVDMMIKQGLEAEVKNLQQFRHLNALNTVGYKEIFKYLDGDWTLDLAIEKIKINTRRYAKRQLTWFKRDNEIMWFHPDELQKILKHILKN